MVHQRVTAANAASTIETKTMMAATNAFAFHRKGGPRLTRAHETLLATLPTLKSLAERTIAPGPTNIKALSVFVHQAGRGFRE
jgi:hypothetical protein